MTEAKRQESEKILFHETAKTTQSKPAGLVDRPKSISEAVSRDAGSLTSLMMKRRAIEKAYEKERLQWLAQAQ